MAPVLDQLPVLVDDAPAVVAFSHAHTKDGGRNSAGMHVYPTAAMLMLANSLD